MPECKPRKSISGPMKQCKADFCYIPPLGNTDSDIDDLEDFKTPLPQNTQPATDSTNDLEFFLDNFKNSSKCGAQICQNPSINFRCNIPKIRGKYLDDFQFLGCLGKGACGRVQKIKNRQTNTIYAGKTILKSTDIQTNIEKNKKLQSEIKLYRKLLHSNIPQLHQIYVWRNSYTLIMDYVKGECLHSLVDFNHNEEQKIAKIIYQILDCLEYLHSKNIVHHDIKPQNILFDPKTGIVKIVDFGEAVQMNSDAQVMFKQGGTFPYFAPQIFNNICTTKMDVWACGLILHYLLDGNIYFYEQSRQRMMHKILSKPIQFQGYNWNNRTASVKDLILKMLEKDYNKRVSAAQAKQHPWIVRHCRNWVNPSKNIIETIIKVSQRRNIKTNNEKPTQIPIQRKLSWDTATITESNKDPDASRIARRIVRNIKQSH